MLRTLPTLLFQSLVFGCLLVFLSLGSVEVLEDGRVVVTLCEFDSFNVYGRSNIGNQAFKTTSGSITFNVIEDGDGRIDRYMVELIRMERIRNPSVLVWLMNKVGFSILPNRWQHSEYFNVTVILTQTQYESIRKNITFILYPRH